MLLLDSKCVPEHDTPPTSSIPFTAEVIDPDVLDKSGIMSTRDDENAEEEMRMAMKIADGAHGL